MNEIIEKIKSDKNQSLMYIYSFIALLMFVVLVVAGIRTGGKIIMWFPLGWSFDYMESDYWRQIVYASDLKNIYFNTVDAPFLPFSYIFYHLLYLINPFDAPIKLSSWVIASNQSFNRLIYVLLMGIKIALFYKAFEKILDGKFKRAVVKLFTSMILFSIPVLFGAVEDGNIIFLVYSMLLLAVYYRDSENKYHKELALILIAISAAIKAYPAIMGLLYLKEKRYKEAIRLIIYGAILVFIPFAFTGGIKGFIQYLSTLKYFQTNTIPRFTSISPMLLAVVDTFLPNLEKTKVLPFNFIVQNIYLAINVISFFKCKRKSVSFIFLCGILSIYVPDSYRYTAGYMMIAFVILLLEKNIRNIDYIYFGLFVMIFIIPVYTYYLNISVVDFFVYLPIYIMSVVAYYDVWLGPDKKLVL